MRKPSDGKVVVKSKLNPTKTFALAVLLLSASVGLGQELPGDLPAQAARVESAELTADPQANGATESDITPLADSAPKQDPLSYVGQRAKVKFSLAGVAQTSGVTGSWWNLSEAFAPDAGYKPDRAWEELWIKPGVTADLRIHEEAYIYGGVSYVGSGNVGRDVFEQGNRGLYAIEDGYLGARIGEGNRDSQWDVSYGRQQYKIGSGMLIAVGAYNGFERGATTSFARRAWEEAGMIKWKRGIFSLDGFYLNPNELRSSDTNTRLAGAKTEINLDSSRSVGVAYMNVFESTLPYVGAPLVLIPNGREGLNTIHTYNRWHPLQQDAPGFYFAGDYAYQWNDRISMASNAYSGEIGNQFKALPFTPRIAYTYRLFQGDDPSTTKFEKFDPLFYEGSPVLWATGSNGSFSFVNSNVQSHKLSLSLNVSERDTLSFYYWHILVDQLNSPVQFGQAGRLVVVGGEPQLVTGVADSHLSDDFYIENFRILSPNAFLTTGVAVSVPGDGLRELTANPTTWFGGLISFAFQY